MLSQTEFDLWADGYDEAVGVSDGENSYPFAGYKEVLGTIFDRVLRKEKPAVLDLGFGTGTLTAKLYERGCAIYGQDFSARMAEIAGAKMPGAALYQKDLTEGLVEPLTKRKYDFIVATYSLHHLTDGQKAALLRQLVGLLREDGEILIGDVAFQSRAELNACRAEAGEDWDDEELYFVSDEMRTVFPEMTFEKVSFCAGILTLKRI